MISVKNFAFTEINKRYFNKKIYLDGKKLKMTVFSSSIISFTEALIFFFMFNFFYLNNVKRIYKLVNYYIYFGNFR
jgi:hypothetical protein